jgi:16S rRNA (uracil1498-N3)-methyltransferase
VDSEINVEHNQKQENRPSELMWRHLPRFFMSACAFKQDELFKLDRKTLQHAVHARRLKVGHYFIVFDGTSAEYLVQMHAISKHEASACWRASQKVSRESALHTTLLMGLIASDKMDWVIQKATELGVNVIQPLLTQFSFKLTESRWSEKQEHWKEVAISACEQSGRNQVPDILLPCSLPEAIKHYSKEPNSMKYMLSPFAEYALGTLLHEHSNCSSVILLVGSEGGLSKHEEQICIEQGWVQCGLGSRILRAETAALAALSGVQIYGGS